MDQTQNSRKIQLSVTNFLHFGDEFLFLHRNINKRVDPGRLNGIGGKVESGENYLEAAIRETEEETGYKIKPEDMKLAGVVKLEGGYEVDWAMCFFKVEVSSKTIPMGSETEDGKLIWLDKDNVLDSGYELVDDLTYCFKDIAKSDGIFFMTAKLDDSEKIYKVNYSRISQ